MRVYMEGFWLWGQGTAKLIKVGERVSAETSTNNKKIISNKTDKIISKEDIELQISQDKANVQRNQILKKRWELYFRSTIPFAMHKRKVASFNHNPIS